MHVLPPPGSPKRDLFDVADLVAIALGERPFIVLPEAKAQARRVFARNKAARRVVFIVLSATDNLELISVGRRGGHRREWVFGPLPRIAFQPKQKEAA